MGVLDKFGLCFDLQCPPALTDKAAALARTFGGVTFVLTHAGYPPLGNDDAFAGWSEGMAKLAEQSNVVVKLSGLMLAEKAWNPEHARGAADVLLERFGAERVLIASNFPVDRLFASLDDLFGSYRRWISNLSETDQSNILYRNTYRIYGLEG